MKPGLYKLIEDVKNPTPDRRKDRDWRAAVGWQKGKRFVIRIVDGLPRLCGSRRWPYQEISERNPIAVALLPNLEACQAESVEDYLWLREFETVWLPDALDVLIGAGKLTLADLGAAIQAAQAVYDAEQAAEQDAADPIPMEEQWDAFCLANADAGMTEAELRKEFQSKLARSQPD